MRIMTIKIAFILITTCGLVNVVTNIVLFISWLRAEKNIAELGGKTVWFEKKEDKNGK